MLKDKSFTIILFIFISAVLMVIAGIVLGSIGLGKDLAFYTLSGISVLSALGVVALRNLVYSGFLLVLTFISVAGIYMLLNADFLAAAQILINGGAVTIMLIFGIWLTNNQTDTANLKYSGTYRYVAFVFVGLGLFLVLLLRLLGLNFNINSSQIFSQSPVEFPVTEPVAIDTTLAIGMKFFNEYLIPFEIASVILLMALIGSIVLAISDKKKDSSTDDVIANGITNTRDNIDVYKTNEAPWKESSVIQNNTDVK